MKLEYKKCVDGWDWELTMGVVVAVSNYAPHNTKEDAEKSILRASQEARDGKMYCSIRSNAGYFDISVGDQETYFPDSYGSECECLEVINAVENFLCNYKEMV